MHAPTKPDPREAYVCPVCKLALSRFAGKQHERTAHKTCKAA